MKLKGGKKMNLGKVLVKIRKDNKMSQEDFAEHFHVSRQTISSWENQKSYPDIETLIQISEEFNVSLDILLKGNERMVKEIDKKVKNNKKLTQILLFVLTLFILLLIVACGNFSLKKEEEKRKQVRYEKIRTTLKELGFSEPDGMGFSEIEENQVKYKVYIKMPQALEPNISASTNWSEEEAMVADYSNDRAVITYLNENRKTIYCDKDGNILNPKQNKNLTEIYKKYQTRTKEIVVRMAELSQEIYQS